MTGVQTCALPICPLPWGRVDLDGSLVVGDDAVDDRETEAGALLERAAERLEDPVELLGRDAAALILDAQHDVDGMLDRAFKLAYQRTPTEAERTDAKKILERQTPLAGGEDQAWTDLCQTLLSTNEFLYVN